MAADPLDRIAEICHTQPHDALTQIAAVLGFNEPSADHPTWVLMSRPGWSVVRKGPFRDRRLVEQMVRDLYALHPDATLMVVNAPATVDPTDGREWVAMFGDQRRKRIPPATAGVGACQTEKDCEWQPWCRMHDTCRRKVEQERTEKHQRNAGLTPPRTKLSDLRGLLRPDQVLHRDADDPGAGEALPKTDCAPRASAPLSPVSGVGGGDEKKQGGV